MDSIINLELLRHPYNWIIVAVVLMIWACALRLLVPDDKSISGLTTVA